MTLSHGKLGFVESMGDVLMRKVHAFLSAVVLVSGFAANPAWSQSRERSEEHFNRVDKNRDRKMTLDEFHA